MSPRKNGGKRYKVLKAILDGLEEIQYYFESEGFSENDEENSGERHEDGGMEDSGVEQETSGDDDEYEESPLAANFDREDIELAIDECVSHLIRRKLIPKPKDRHASMSDVLERFLGKDHPIVIVAITFEDYIQGYFGLINSSDMDAAYQEFVKLREAIAEELELSSRA